MLNDDLIRKLKDDPAFNEFQRYLISIVDSLNNVQGLNHKTNEEAGETAKVRALTIEKITEILSPFVEFKEKSGPSEESMKKAINKFAL